MMNEPIKTTTTAISIATPVDTFDEKKFIDYVKLACLLCKRGFDSTDLLNKHVQMSSLHKVYVC